MSQDTAEGIEDGKEIVKYSVHQSDVFVGILLKGNRLCKQLFIR